MRNYFTLVTVLLFSCLTAKAQMRNIYTDADANNQVKGISFFQPDNGYVAFEKWVGYTVDSGHTFSRKYVTLSNVDYNGYSVNLTFGFTINGVHAFSQDSILLYGDYGLNMAILFSKDGGNSFKLVHQASIGSYKKLLFTNNTTGYAVSEQTIWKTTNRGQTWSFLFNITGGNEIIDFKNYGTDYLYFLTPTLIYKSINAGSGWSTIANPANSGTNLSFDIQDQNKIWLSTNGTNSFLEGNLYFSNNGGTSWSIKNNGSIYKVSSTTIKFVNDSTGYLINDSFNIYKTTDAGAIWERLPRNNDYSYLGYTHSVLFFYNNQQFWAGGAHGFLELTTNGGGSTLPNAQFNIIRTYEYIANGTVQLYNLSKQGVGYTYRWIRNRVTISTSYHSSYIANHYYIDTISLIVSKNGVSDTLVKYLDTRPAVQPCFANFTFTQSDTGRVAFTSTYHDVGRTHKWYFGDGSVDSTSVSPVHFYSAAGTFTIKHIIYNVVSNCGDSTTATITINRAKACLTLSIRALPDTFFNNKISFQLAYDTAAESGSNPVTTPVNWTFGNGATAMNTTYANITYNAAGTYNVCVSAKNWYTGCISQVCKTVQVVFDTCNAAFVINPSFPAGTYFMGNRFEGKKLNTDVGKAHYWIINGTDTISTGNRNYLDKEFSKQGTDGRLFNDFRIQGGDLCGDLYTREINIDSLNKSVKHMLVDSLNGCVVISTERVFTIPTRIPNVKITAYPDPEVPNLVTFTATQTYGSSSSPSPYYSTWRKNYTSYAGGSPISNSILMGHTAIGTYNYAVSASTCPGGDVREVYAINYKVTSLDTCGAKKPVINVRRYVDNLRKVSFLDSSWIGNSALQNKTVIYYGNGDSTVMNANGVTYTYTQSGYYNYKITATCLRTGCVKSTSGFVEISCPKPSFIVLRDSTLPRQISFINKTLPDTANVNYLWRFGNGDSSSSVNPVYNYIQAGVYSVSLRANFTNGCSLQFDSIIVVANVPCTIGDVFKDSTHVIVCDTDSVNMLSFFNTTGYSLTWNTNTPSTVSLGIYRMMAVDSNYCADISKISIVQDTAIFTGLVSSDWHNPANWSKNRLPGSKSHVVIKNSTGECVLSAADVYVASLQVLRYRTFRVTNGRRVFITSSCQHLPYVPL